MADPGPQPSNGVVDMIVKRVRRLIGSQSRDKDLIIGHLEIVNDEMAAKFQSYGLKFDTRVVVLPDISANTTDLRDLQVLGQPLFDLMVPESLEWKLAGQSEIRWKAVADLPVVVDTNLGSGTGDSEVMSDRAWVESWEWRGGTIWISPCSQNVDLRVRGQFMPNLIDSDSQDPIRAAINILAFFTAASVVITDGGPQSVRAKDFRARGMNALGDFQSNQVKAQQGKIMRLAGRRDRVRNTGFGASSFGPPVDSGNKVTVLAQTYDLLLWREPRQQTPNQELFRARIEHDCTFPVNFDGSGISINPGSYSTGSPVFRVNRIRGGGSAQVGTIRITAGANAATFATIGFAAAPFLTGDEIQLLGDAVPDPSLANWAITLVSSRTS
jgi:hypothetical protein